MRNNHAAIVSFFLMLLFVYSSANAQDQALWEKYKSAFIDSDGRVVDYYQNNTSHSEGQGVGMLLAVAHNDHTAFDKLWTWTRTNMTGRLDNIFPWLWGQRANGVWDKIDYNNATDGDILISYALVKAAEKWPDNTYRKEGLIIVEAIRKQLAIEWHGQTFLLPSYSGFNKANNLILNPSYIIFPAYRHFAQMDNKLFWEKAYKDGASLLGKSCFGAFCLPSDWVLVNEMKPSVYKEKSSLFGYEAIRTLLYIAVEKDLKFPQGLEKLLDLYAKLGYMPEWVDLDKDSISLTPSSAGFYAIYSLVAKKTGKVSLSEQLFKEAKEKLKHEKENYYSLSLYLLAISPEIF